MGKTPLLKFNAAALYVAPHKSLLPADEPSELATTTHLEAAGRATSVVPVVISSHRAALIPQSSDRDKLADEDTSDRGMLHRLYHALLRLIWVKRLMD